MICQTKLIVLPLAHACEVKAGQIKAKESGTAQSFEPKLGQHVPLKAGQWESSYIMCMH